MVKHLLQLCGVSVVSMLLVTFVLVIASKFVIVEGEAPHIDKELYKKIYHLTDDVQDEWEYALNHSPIERIVSEGYAGLATKYLVIFESGHIAIAKLVEPFSLVEHDWESISSEDPERYAIDIGKGTTYSRSGRKFQAWTEVAAYYVSRIAFPVAKKPPAVIRSVSSSKLYGCDGCYSWSDYVKWMLPEHEVYISVHAFLNKMRISEPSTAMMEFLTNTKTVHPLTSRDKKETLENAKLVSDVIVFDFIMDDHDRKRSHNWMLDGDDKLMLWDSGLCFQHGPVGRSSCTSLLCGPDSWQTHGKKVHNLKHCAKVCRFRKETIESLQSLSPAYNMGNLEKTLGNQLREKVESLDVPILEWNLYYQFGQGFPKVKFLPSDFYSGLNTKLTKFLEHFEECQDAYGKDVFI